MKIKLIPSVGIAIITIFSLSANAQLSKVSITIGGGLTSTPFGELDHQISNHSLTRKSEEIEIVKNFPVSLNYQLTEHHSVGLTFAINQTEYAFTTDKFIATEWTGDFYDGFYDGFSSVRLYFYSYSVGLKYEYGLSEQKSRLQHSIGVGAFYLRTNLNWKVTGFIDVPESPFFGQYLTIGLYSDHHGLGTQIYYKAALRVFENVRILGTAGYDLADAMLLKSNAPFSYGLGINGLRFSANLEWNFGL